MTAHPIRRATAALVAAGVVLAALAVMPAASAQELPPLPEEGAPVYAIVSPVANPVCQASGSATLLVPILGGLVGQNLGTGDLPIGDLVLDSLGPVFIVCGSLPPSPGSRCQLDDQIAGVLPDQLTSVLPPPAILGNVVDAVGAALDPLGLSDATASLTPALQCSIAGPSEAVGAPPAPPTLPLAPPSLPGSAPLALPTMGGGAALPALGSPAAAPGGVAPATTTPASAPQAVLDLITRVVPGWLQLLQLLLGGVLLAFLASSWTTSLRIRRAP